MNRFLLVLGLLSLVACGDDPEQTIGSLDLEQSRALCQDVTDAQGGAGTVVMCDGFEIRVQEVDECATTIEAATCERTVGELNECLDRIDGNACNIFTDELCGSVFGDCLTIGS